MRKDFIASFSAKLERNSRESDFFFFFGGGGVAIFRRYVPRGFGYVIPVTGRYKLEAWNENADNA